ncbi:MAG: beta-lactamase family protein [Armatimonadetes bacterium]|nr:beta-lactamase family protein [Armatimonadota bacterium]
MRLDEQKLARAAECARGYVLNGSLPTALVAVADRERLRWVRGFGEGGRDDPSLEERVFPLASITKAVTAVGIARLVNQGRLNYDDPVAHHIPEFARDAGRARITTEQILTHTTGLPGMSLKELCGGGYRREDSYRVNFDGDLVFPPGTRTAYATLTYQLLNEIIFRRLRQRMEAFLKETVLDPCGMTSTGFRPDPARAMPNLSFPLPDPENAARFVALELSGGGLWSSLGDLVRLAQALLQPGRLMRPGTFALMTEPRPNIQWSTGSPTRRTRGWVKDPLSDFPRQPDAGFFHGGATGTFLWIDPEADFIFVFLSNLWCSRNDHSFATLNLLSEGG